MFQYRGSTACASALPEIALADNIFILIKCGIDKVCKFGNIFYQSDFSG